MKSIVVLALLAGVFVAPRAAAQDFVPPKNAKHGGTRIGLFGFGVRGGVDFRRSGQLVLGTTLDIGDLFSNRLRLRPSAEVGLFNGGDSRPTRRSPPRTSAAGSRWPAATAAGPIQDVPASGSTPSSVSSCITARRSTGWSSITAWTRCAGTGCTSVLQRGEETEWLGPPT